MQGTPVPPLRRSARVIPSLVFLFFLFPILFSASPTVLGAGPDVIVSDIYQTIKWGTIDGITAYSIGTEACNVGDVPVPWEADTASHPVIAQNLYRLENGRLEQIGMSWLKHGFAALADSDCGTCEDPGTTALLGVNCSDAYSATLNGQQGGFFGIGGLGPRSEVNPVTGVFDFPYGTQGQSGDDVYKRLQVANVDLDPAAHPDARYFLEAHYVTPDDSAAGNFNNNASCREVQIGDLSGGGWDLDLIGSTLVAESITEIWADLDPEVLLSIVDVSSGGRFQVASKVQPSGGDWCYEYAVHNLSSHRSGQALDVPLPDTASVLATGFRDVAYHSGEPYDGTDWTVATLRGSAGELTFSTATFAENENANAVRWGTLYAFRFTSDAAPEMGSVTLDLFRPGDPASVSATAWVPESLSLETVLAGNVNGAAGPITDVLFVNGSAGSGPERKVTAATTDPLTIELLLPPSGSGEACAVVWLWATSPDQGTIVALPFGLGHTALPSPLTSGPPAPLRIANSFPTRYDRLLGAEHWPQSPTAKAPTVLLSVPQGVGRGITIFVQGLVEDAASPEGRVAVTNGISLCVQ
jgi:hypothetical protein